MLILTVIQGPDRGRRFRLPDDEPQLIGRSSEALPLTDQAISRRHAELTPDDGRWYINDLISANGTFVNGKRVAKPTLLNPGDQIRTGQTLITFGVESVGKVKHPVRVAKPGEIDVAVEHTTPSNDDSMIMAVPNPDEAAVRQLKVIYELTQLIGSNLDPKDLLEKVMDLIFEYFRVDRGFILLGGKPDQRPEPVVVRHRVPPRSGGSGGDPRNKSESRITVSRTIVQHVMRKSEGVLSSNAMTDKHFASSESVQAYGIRSAICVPIKVKEKLFGVIYIDSQVANYTYTKDQLQLLITIGVLTAMALDNARLFAERLQRERLAAMGQTVASLSHSIKNILQGMRGGADVVELGLKKQNLKVIGSGWDIVSRNLERISALMLNMLAYSKQRQPELELTNVGKLVSEVVALVQNQFDAKKVALILDCDPDIPPIPMDASGAHQAMLNILQNALDAAHPEFGVVTLACEFDQATQVLRLRVADNGPGIPEEVRGKIFMPFHSTKGYKGTGLGLAVTKKIVEEHGGRVLMDTSPGRGTTFTLEFPVTPTPGGGGGTHAPSSETNAMSRQSAPNAAQ
jgi:signal transduction histidine kinase